LGAEAGAKKGRTRGGEVAYDFLKKKILSELKLGGEKQAGKKKLVRANGVGRGGEKKKFHN